MCNNKDSLEAYLRDRWAPHAPLWWQDARRARCAARRPGRCVRSSTGSLSCRGTQHACLQLLPAKALVPLALVMVPPSVIPEHSALRTYPSRSIQAIRLSPSQFIIITYYKDYKIIFIFNSFTCTGWPDPIDPGHFEFASRNLVGLPIIMPLIDTN